MGLGNVLQRAVAALRRSHGDALSFAREVEGAGITGRADAGMAAIPTRQVVGSVSRAQNLRSDFFYRTGRAVTARFVSIGKAMERGTILPPIEVYKARLRRRRAEGEAAVTEYYVVDGHHRVAMARKLGQAYLDAHVVEYRVAGRDLPPDAPPAPPDGEGRPQPRRG